jgi:hypothetical protein
MGRDTDTHISAHPAGLIKQIGCLVLNGAVVVVIGIALVLPALVPLVVALVFLFAFALPATISIAIFIAVAIPIPITIAISVSVMMSCGAFTTVLKRGDLNSAKGPTGDRQDEYPRNTSDLLHDSTSFPFGVYAGDCLFRHFEAGPENRSSVFLRALPERPMADRS